MRIARPSRDGFADLPLGENDPPLEGLHPMRDEKTIQERLEPLRGLFLHWGTPDLRVFVITKDELRGWLRALEWILGNAKGP